MEIEPGNSKQCSEHRNRGRLIKMIADFTVGAADDL